jgi:hypothetical protein
VLTVEGVAGGEFGGRLLAGSWDAGLVLLAHRAPSEEFRTAAGVLAVLRSDHSRLA